MMENLLRAFKAELRKPVALVGMMGSGKSAMGPALASGLDLPFYDSDVEIEKSESMSIAHFFELFSEQDFREREYKMLGALVSLGPSVIATGGGAVSYPDTLEFLKKNTLMVWLDVPFEVLWERVRYTSHRPLLQVPDAKTRLKKLLEDRRSLYAQARYHVSLNDEDRACSLSRLIKILLEGSKKDSL